MTDGERAGTSDGRADGGRARADRGTSQAGRRTMADVDHTPPFGDEQNDMWRRGTRPATDGADSPDRRAAGEHVHEE